MQLDLMFVVQPNPTRDECVERVDSNLLRLLDASPGDTPVLEEESLQLRLQQPSGNQIKKVNESPDQDQPGPAPKLAGAWSSVGMRHSWLQQCLSPLCDASSRINFEIAET